MWRKWDLTETCSWKEKYFSSFVSSLQIFTRAVQVLVSQRWAALRTPAVSSSRPHSIQHGQCLLLLHGSCTCVMFMHWSSLLVNAGFFQQTYPRGRSHLPGYPHVAPAELAEQILCQPADPVDRVGIVQAVGGELPSTYSPRKATGSSAQLPAVSL